MITSPELGVGYQAPATTRVMPSYLQFLTQVARSIPSAGSPILLFRLLAILFYLNNLLILGICDR
jgi:hypothetical protein